MIFWKRFRLENISGSWGNWYIVIDLKGKAMPSGIATENLKEAINWLQENEPETVQLTLF